MKRKTWSQSIAIILALIFCIGSISTFAAGPIEETHVIEEIIDEYVAIILCANVLTLNAGGRLTCGASTDTLPTYTAEVKMELQKQNTNGTWSTIKTWSGSGKAGISLVYDWYVVNGTYRLQLTHTSRTSSGSLVENVIKYSKTVVY